MKDEIQMIVLSSLIAFIVGAIAHERDIYRNLRKFGDAGLSAWTCKIYSKEMKGVKQ